MENFISCCPHRIHSFEDICYCRVSKKTYTCAAHVQPMLFRAGGSGVCVKVCLYERQIVREKTYLSGLLPHMHFLFTPVVLYLRLSIKPPVCFLGHSTVQWHWVWLCTSAFSAAQLVVLLNVIYALERFKHTSQSQAISHHVIMRKLLFYDVYILYTH